jgi:hypothetical protein
LMGEGWASDGDSEEELEEVGNELEAGEGEVMGELVFFADGRPGELVREEVSRRRELREVPSGVVIWSSRSSERVCSEEGSPVLGSAEERALPF